MKEMLRSRSGVGWEERLSVHDPGAFPAFPDEAALLSLGVWVFTGASICRQEGLSPGPQLHSISPLAPPRHGCRADPKF